MSELEFYRPVAMIIEMLFRKSQFEINDTSIGRGVDLLMEVLNIGLSSSEWKRSNVGKKLGESQQRPNPPVVRGRPRANPPSAAQISTDVPVLVPSSQSLPKPILPSWRALKVCHLMMMRRAKFL
ncbi:uncharacterized protein EV154DRAFT_487556 [Mucor mucedo]|uniref:uncharacterized protein n=1 Tax=Mucor mucedo TaxID=29922 RepID=UPI002220EF47|nr:uncharacterized protein EV154DRAFT_487556 [Mucor mucedo]KAI7872270.1 hypothetical protein EV154DRAFT_487556 [Mucor mucedo]